MFVSVLEPGGTAMGAHNKPLSVITCASSTSCIGFLSTCTFTPVYVMTHASCLCAERVQQTVK